MKITKPEITNQYIRVPASKKQSGDTIRTITISSKQGIKALYAVNRKKIVTYLFSRAKNWTMAKAKAWIKSHKTDKSLTNKAMDQNRFKFVLPIIKTRVKIIKDENGDEKEEHYIVGKASSTDKDLVGDKMAPSAIKTMADSIKQHIINLNAEHNTSWLFELGDVTKLDITKDFDLVFESKLNEMSASKDLWYALTELDKKLGVSIGGYVKEYDYEKEEDTGERVRVFKAIELDHIAIVSEPANPKTWVEAIQKSLKNTELLTNAGKEDSDVKSKLIFKDNGMKKKKDSLEAKKLANPETEKKTEKKVEAGKETKVEKKTEAKKETKVEKKAKVEKEAKVEKKVETKKEKVEKKKEKESTDKNLSTGAWAVNAAKELAYAISWLKSNKKDTSRLEAALEEIKGVASDELKEKEEKKMEKKVKKTKVIKKVKASKLVKKAVGKLSKSLEKKFASLEEGIEGLSKRLEAIEEMPEERKGVDISKGIGSESDGGAIDKSEKDLEKALNEVEKKYINDSDRVFAEKARIRQQYKDNYGIE